VFEKKGMAMKKLHLMKVTLQRNDNKLHNEELHNNFFFFFFFFY